MKIKILFFVLVISICSCHSDDDSLAKKEELKSILTEYYSALAKKDIKKLNAATTSSFILFEEGTVYTNESAVKAIEQMKPYTVSFSIDSLNVHMDKTNASAYYFRKADFIFDDTDHLSMRFLESATFNKEDGKWKLRFLHSSVRK
jgi:hypothetical protein